MQPSSITTPTTDNKDGASLPAPAKQQGAPPLANAVAQAEFIWKVHPYTNEYIRFADTKAAAVIAWCAALIGLLFSLKAHQRFMQSAIIVTNIDWGATALATASLLAFILLALAVLAAFWCVKPSLWSKDASKTHDPGYIYWEKIRAHQHAAAFKAGLTQQTAADLTGHCIDHVYVLAGIAKRKYKCVDRSILLALFGSVLASIVALFAR